jgi:hypothetical protein
MFLDQLFQGLGFQGPAAGHPALARSHALGQGRLVTADNQRQVPFLGHPVAEFDHLRDLVAGVHMHHRKRHMAEEGLARQPQEDIGVLADGPQHGDLVDAVEGFAKDENALAFQSVQITAHNVLITR